MEQAFKLRFAQSEREQLEAYAEREDMTKSDVIRMALAAMGVITLADGVPWKRAKE